MKLLFICILVVIVILIIEQICRYRNKTLLEIFRRDWFEDVTRFPNDSFECKTNCEIYNKQVEEGYEIMKTKK